MARPRSPEEFLEYIKKTSFQKGVRAGHKKIVEDGLTPVTIYDRELRRLTETRQSWLVIGMIGPFIEEE